MSKFSRASQQIVDAIVGVFEAQKPPLSVRQVYYQLATSGLVPLSQLGYRQAQRLLLKVREEGVIPWHHFADRTREVKRYQRWGDVQDFAETVRGAYRKDYWQSQPDHVEIWLEKDALSGVVGDVTMPYGIDLWVARGFSSATFVHDAAEALAEIDKPKFIYYLGDHDPSGMSIEQALQERLREFGAEFSFKRIAITLEDIKTYDLRPLEAKKTDSRCRKYVAEHGQRTIELDALPPNVLRARIHEAIVRHIDWAEWKRLGRVEQLERESINNLFSNLGGATS